MQRNMEELLLKRASFFTTESESSFGFFRWFRVGFTEDKLQIEI